MEIIIKGEAKELAALVQYLQKQPVEDICEEVGAEFAKQFHQKIQAQLKANPFRKESR